MHHIFHQQQHSYGRLRHRFTLKAYKLEFNAGHKNLAIQEEDLQALPSYSILFHIRIRNSQVILLQ